MSASSLFLLEIFIKAYQQHIYFLSLKNNCLWKWQKLNFIGVFFRCLQYSVLLSYASPLFTPVFELSLEALLSVGLVITLKDTSDRH